MKDKLKKVGSNVKKEIKSTLKKDKSKKNDFQGFFTYFVIILIPSFVIWFWQGKNICLLAKNFENPNIPNPFSNLYSHTELGYMGYLKSVFTNVMNLNGSIVEMFSSLLNNTFLNNYGLALFASFFVMAFMCIPFIFIMFWVLWFIISDYNPLFRPLSWLYILVTFVFSLLFTSVCLTYNFYSLYWYPLMNYDGSNFFMNNYNSIILIISILASIGGFIYLELWLAIVFMILLPTGFVITKYV
tara:strand:+ start:2891 stop:3619 length:729 start_codon:yes stop_codon:yes gene_type:complete